MKKSICIITTLFIAAGGSVFANNEMNPISYSPTALVSCIADTSQNTPEAKAMKHATYMEQKLKLSSSQKQQVYNLTLDKVKNTSALKTKYNGDIKAAQPELNQLRTKYDTNIKSVLTPDQVTKWKQLQEDQKVKAQQPSKINEYDPTILDSQW